MDSVAFVCISVDPPVSAAFLDNIKFKMLVMIHEPVFIVPILANN